jgi:hypothetical protein
MNGTNIIAHAPVADPRPSWHVAGTGDFNGDGKSDILLQNTDGQVSIWEMNGTNIIATLPWLIWSELARHRNRRRWFRHPSSKHERPNLDLEDERDKHSPRRPCQHQSRAELACDRLT